MKVNFIVEVELAAPNDLCTFHVLTSLYKICINYSYIK